MEIRSLSPNPGVEVRDVEGLGVEVRGVDLRRPLRPAALGELQVALERHHLLCFRGQELSDDEHAAAVGQFGPVAWEGLDERRAVGYVSNHRPGGALGSRAATFHIDYVFTDDPYEAISLYALELPAGGTETRFADAIAAARDLPQALRMRLDGLVARAAVDVSCPVGEAGVRVRLGRLDETYPHALRPVLWPHPTSGGAVLAVWEQQTDAILPLPPVESDALIEELFAHLYRDDHVYVHRWELHDLVLWDNRALQHARPDVGTVYEAPYYEMPDKHGKAELAAMLDAVEERFDSVSYVVVDDFPAADPDLVIVEVQGDHAVKDSTRRGATRTSTSCSSTFATGSSTAGASSRTPTCTARR